jgi:hypothetical protein
MRNVIGLIIGVALIVGGLSGKLVLIGTNSGVALAVVGAVLVVFRLVTMFANRS